MDELLEKHRAPLTLALMVFIVAGGAVLFARRAEAPAVAIVAPTPTVEAAPTPLASPVKVYVSGAVAQPGVYALRRGDRAEDAVRAAGGATAEADLERLNLAVKLRDEMQVHVPRRGEAASAPSAAGGPEGKLNINEATAEQLDALPSIGPVTARRILEYRAQNGPFRRIEELRERKLVAAATFEKIKDLITAR